MSTLAGHVAVLVLLWGAAESPMLAGAQPQLSPTPRIAMTNCGVVHPRARARLGLTADRGTQIWASFCGSRPTAGPYSRRARRQGQQRDDEMQCREGQTRLASSGASRGLLGAGTKLLSGRSLDVVTIEEHLRKRMLSPSLFAVVRTDRRKEAVPDAHLGLGLGLFRVCCLWQLCKLGRGAEHAVRTHEQRGTAVKRAFVLRLQHQDFLVSDRLYQDGGVPGWRCFGSAQCGS